MWISVKLVACNSRRCIIEITGWNKDFLAIWIQQIWELTILADVDVSLPYRMLLNQINTTTTCQRKAWFTTKAEKYYVSDGKIPWVLLFLLDTFIKKKSKFTFFSAPSFMKVFALFYCIYIYSFLLVSVIKLL